MKLYLAGTVAVLALITSMEQAGAAEPAQSPNALALNIVECRTHNPAQEEADFVLLDKAFGLMEGRDMQDLDALMPDLRTALSHAPDVPPAPERCGDTVLLYSDDMTQFLTLSALVAKTSPGGARKVEQRQPLPYALLGFVVGWVEYEHGNYEAAAEAYRKGLRNNPDLVELTTELVLTLSHLGRNTEALDTIDAFVAAHPDLEASDRANLLRKRGYVLVELGRWDDAEAAYTESLRLEPDNKVAKSELDYIQKQKPAK